MDRVTLKLELDPLDHRVINVTAIDIIEQNPIKDDSVYEFTINGLKSKTGTKANIEVKYITAGTPSLVSLKDVLSLASGLKLDEESVMYHIREASKYAMFLMKEQDNNLGDIEITPENIKTEHFNLYNFIKYKALRDCLLDFYIKEVAKPKKIKNQTGDLIYEHEVDLSFLKGLLDDIEEEYEEWEDEFSTVTASPKSVMRGEYSLTKVYPTRLRGSGFGRDRYPTGYDIYGRR